MTTALDLIIIVLLIANLYFLAGNERSLRRIEHEQQKIEETQDHLQQRLKEVEQ